MDSARYVLNLSASACRKSARLFFDFIFLVDVVLPADAGHSRNWLCKPERIGDGRANKRDDRSLVEKPNLGLGGMYINVDIRRFQIDEQHRGGVAPGRHHRA